MHELGPCLQTQLIVVDSRSLQQFASVFHKLISPLSFCRVQFSRWIYLFQPVIFSPLHCRKPLNAVCLAMVFWGTSYENRNATLATDIKWPAASLYSSQSTLLFGRLISRRRNWVFEVWHSCISLKVFMAVMMNATIPSCSTHHWAQTESENEGRK